MITACSIRTVFVLLRRDCSLTRPAISVSFYIPQFDYLKVFTLFSMSILILIPSILNLLLSTLTLVLEFPFLSVKHCVS